MEAESQDAEDGRLVTFCKHWCGGATCNVREAADSQKAGKLEGGNVNPSLQVPRARDPEA